MKGKIGSATQMLSAKDAGVSFRVNKRDRRWLAERRRAKQKLASVQTLRGPRDMAPRLVKPD